jgi:hypothetical protein
VSGAFRDRTHPTYCYNRDSNGNLTARCQAYWKNYSSAVKTELETNVFAALTKWVGPDLDPKTSAHAKAAYESIKNYITYTKGRKTSIKELLAIVAYREFGTETGNTYILAQEALGRQLFEICGSDGICVGDQLTVFLGGLQAWYDLPPDALVGAMTTRQGLETADRIFAEESWRIGLEGGRPWTWGNLSMHPKISDDLISKGSGWSDDQSVALNVNEANIYASFLVWTGGQQNYWLTKEKNKP